MSFNFPFSARAMTQEVRLHPKRYGLVSALNVMPLEEISSTFVQITEEDGVLQVLPAAERGAPGSKMDRKRQSLKIFQVPHFPVEDAIFAKDLQDKKIVLDGEEVPANLPDELAKRQRDMMRRFAITAEYLRMSALKGIIKDGDGNTLTNLFTDFGISQTSIDFVLGTDGTDVRGKDEELRGTIEDAILGDTVDGVEVLVDPVFFSKLVSHPEVADLYKSSPDVGELRKLYSQKTGGISGRVFNPFGGVTYVEYRGKAPTKAGSEAFVEASSGYARPLGTENVFSTFAAPADTLTELNDLPGVLDADLDDGVEPFALPVFMSAEPLKHGKGVELYGETNILPFCKQPKGLVKVTTSN